MGWIPAAAAAAKRRRNEKQESEIIERLSREDAGKYWEFKILRSYASIFSNEEKTRSILDQESRAGWELAARLDSSRLVLRRPVSRRASDAERRDGVDPYRSVVDPEFPLIVVGVIVVVIIAAPLLGQSALATSHKILGLVAVIALAVAVAALVARRR
jgi:hypothetical protein